MANAMRDPVRGTMEYKERYIRNLEVLTASVSRIIYMREFFLKRLEELDDPTPEEQARMDGHRRFLGKWYRRDQRRIARKAKRDRRRDRGERDCQSTDSEDELNHFNRDTDDSSSEAPSDSDSEDQVPAMGSGTHSNGKSKEGETFKTD